MLTYVDVFRFLPVPRDDPVSTKASLAGSLLFLALFLGYLIFDFVQFVTFNKPV